MAKKGIAEAATRAGLAADSAKKPARPRKTASKRPSTGRKPEPPLLPASWIERRILLVRGEKVMIDSDLAELYEVETRALVQAVKRNIDRFPQDFMFRLSASEAALLTSQTVNSNLTSQSVISNPRRGGRRHLPYAFNEQGIAMLSSILRSKRAVQVNLRIVRAFVRMRELLASNRELSLRVDRLESRQKTHCKHILYLAGEIEQLKLPAPAGPKRRIGYPKPTTEDD